LGKNVTANATASSSSPPPTSSATKDPEKEYKSLLRAEVKSTRTSWDDFKRSWKKDRRFFDFGKDDRQREKTFREHLRELGERESLRHIAE
jgi:transcription elongation regulator 1